MALLLADLLRIGLDIVQEGPHTPSKTAPTCCAGGATQSPSDEGTPSREVRQTLIRIAKEEARKPLDKWTRELRTGGPDACIAKWLDMFEALPQEDLNDAQDYFSSIFLQNERFVQQAVSQSPIREHRALGRKPARDCKWRPLSPLMEDEVMHTPGILELQSRGAYGKRSTRFWQDIRAAVERFFAEAGCSWHIPRQGSDSFDEARAFIDADVDPTELMKYISKTVEGVYWEPVPEMGLPPAFRKGHVRLSLWCDVVGVQERWLDLPFSIFQRVMKGRGQWKKPRYNLVEEHFACAVTK